MRREDLAVGLRVEYLGAWSRPQATIMAVGDLGFDVQWDDPSRHRYIHWGLADCVAFRILIEYEHTKDQRLRHEHAMKWL